MARSAQDQLAAYAKGWAAGDGEAILDAVAAGYVFDDPAAGAIDGAAFAGYLAGLKKAVDEVREAPEAAFMELTEVVAAQDGETITAWCWWRIPGTDLQGSGLIKATADGVSSERITYYAAPAS